MKPNLKKTEVSIMQLELEKFRVIQLNYTIIQL